MKKLKGVMAMEPSPYPVPFEDPRARFKYQSLLQDYQDLQKETDAMTKKMQAMKHRKMVLLAEVRFLKRRYEYLSKNNTVNPRQFQSQIQTQDKSMPTNKLKAKKRNYSLKEAPQPRDGAAFESNKKTRVVKGKKAAPQSPVPYITEKIVSRREAAQKKFSPIFDLNQGDMASAPIRNSASVFDMDQKERHHSGKEAATRSSAPFFDLNQISRDEDELQMNTEASRFEEPCRSLITSGSGNDEQLNDMKLSGCRNVGNGSSRAGKRKITWQDQVALRV